MMKFYLVLAFLGLPISYAIAQKLPSETKNATTRIFPTYAKVYSAPAQDASVNDSLASNRVVQISVDEEQTAADWFSVSYQAGKQKKKGYVRADALAFAMAESGNFQVLFGKYYVKNRKQPIAALP
ncbi:hypothetical protein FIC_01620 [Flavobacteriaceae bacterium 3519-10]|nr:hypothetical protein FIC_01620 [Flavobacteriaceae bacterium 3519-10]